MHYKKTVSQYKYVNIFKSRYIYLRRKITEDIKACLLIFFIFILIKRI